MPLLRTGAVLILLLNIAVAHAQQEDKDHNPAYWTDPETHLTWSTADNGSGVSWSQAVRYCASSNVGGFKDWKLPDISDLQRLFGGKEDARGYHIRGPAKLSGWQWSATAGERPGEGWALDFGDGARASVAAGDSGLNRALCVRSTSNDRIGPNWRSNK